jgi:hypothetical protein
VRDGIYFLSFPYYQQDGQELDGMVRIGDFRGLCLESVNVLDNTLVLRAHGAKDGQGNGTSI